MVFHIGAGLELDGVVVPTVYGASFFGSTNDVLIVEPEGSSAEGDSEAVVAVVDYWHFVENVGVESEAESGFDVSVVGIVPDANLESKMTNEGKRQLWESFFRGGSVPSVFRAVLCTDNEAGDFTPTIATVHLSELKEIPNGNGYVANGIRLYPNTTNFPTVSIDSGVVSVSVKTLVWTAVAGAIPKNGSSIRYLVIVDGGNHVIAWYELSQTGIQVPQGQSLVINDIVLKLSELA